MTDDAKPTPDKDDAEKKIGAAEKPGSVPRRELMPLPGLAAIALYMLVLSGIAIVSVAEGQAPPVDLIFSAAFVAAGLGLMLLLRWAWALTLSAVLLLAVLFLRRFATGHALPSIVQGLLNLVFFFYLIRKEVREKLR